MKTAARRRALLAISVLLIAISGWSSPARANSFDSLVEDCERVWGNPVAVEHLIDSLIGKRVIGRGMVKRIDASPESKPIIFIESNNYQAVAGASKEATLPLRIGQVYWFSGYLKHIENCQTFAILETSFD